MQYYLDVLKNYVKFDGRARRKEYWMFFLINVIISVGLQIIGGIIHLSFLQGLYSLAVLLPSLGVAVRRMHDVNKSGWYLLIPIYNLVLACTEGTKGANQYGSDPKEQPQSQG